jgi:hypothetical protein
MRCTCAGTVPGYLHQHEDGCGQPEPDEDEVPMPDEPTEPFIDGYWITPCPRCRWLPELHAGPCLPVEGGAE